MPSPRLRRGVPLPRGAMPNATQGYYPFGVPGFPMHRDPLPDVPRGACTTLEGTSPSDPSGSPVDQGAMGASTLSPLIAPSWALPMGPHPLGALLIPGTSNGGAPLVPWGSRIPRMGEPHLVPWDPGYPEWGSPLGALGIPDTPKAKPPWCPWDPGYPEWGSPLGALGIPDTPNGGPHLVPWGPRIPRLGKPTGWPGDPGCPEWGSPNGALGIPNAPNGEPARRHGEPGCTEAGRPLVPRGILFTRGGSVAPRCCHQSQPARG
jgi:hypothetical protein